MSLQNEPRRLRADVVRAIHEAHIAEHGGINGIRSTDLLDSALARPQLFASFEAGADLLSIGAMHAIAIARNHPFLDGNKRTAWVVMRAFLELNDIPLTYEAADAVTIMLALAASELSDEEFVAWVRRAAR